MSEAQPRPSIAASTPEAPGAFSSARRAASASGRSAPRAGKTVRCAVRSIIWRRMRSWKPESSASETISAATPTARPTIEIVAISATWARRRDAAR